MYEFVIEKCDFISDDECDIYPVHQEFNLDFETVMEKVRSFASAHPDGCLTSGSGHLIEYEIDGAELSCYVDYTPRTKNILNNEEGRPLNIDILEEKGDGLWKKALRGE